MKNVRATIGILITGAAVTMAFTVLFLSMRAVMAIGGSCGSSGTGLPSCPGHTAGLLPAAIWGGLIFAGLYVWQTAKNNVPSFVSLLWPALFLSLGYNFFDYAFSNGAIGAGFIVCGVVFGLMGGLPLLFAVPHLWRVYALGQEADAPWHVSATGSAVNSLKTLSRLGSKPDMTESLARLDDLHKKGALSDFEFAKAKDKIISKGTS